MRPRFVSIALTAELRAPRESLPPSLRPRIAGLTHAVAESIDRHVQTRALGYYPALSHLRAHTQIDPGALQSLETAMEEARRHVTRLTLHRLNAPFARIHCDHSLPLAATIPPVDPRDPERLTALIRHYQPDLIRLHLIAHARVRETEPCMVAYVRERAIRWLNGCFCGRITYCDQLQP